MAGQSVKLGVPNGPSHSYSIASAPSDPYLEFCIELVPGGRLTPRLFALRAGAKLTLGNSAKGKLVLQTGKLKHVMLATVTGIAPLRSIVREAFARRALGHQFWVLHGASYAHALPFRDELEALLPRVSYEPTVSRPGEAQNSQWSGTVGRVDALATSLVTRVGRPGEVAVYACGNPGMISSVRAQLAPLDYSLVSETFK